VSLGAEIAAQGAVKLDPQWRALLEGEFQSPYMAELKAFLQSERDAGRVVFPRAAFFFRALDLTPPDKVKIVILGQDPYHGEGQAEGLCFSVPKSVKPPPSLVNIFKELKNDLDVDMPTHGHLGYWAVQGVLLLNATLSVRQSQAGSHQGRGWERFTDAVIDRINRGPNPVVFILWGAYAQKKAALVDRNRHLILSSVHPSPLSAHGGFFGSKPFSKANAFLVAKGIDPIDWDLSHGD
jgi:uracil-DNA glycosylase